MGDLAVDSHLSDIPVFRRVLRGFDFHGLSVFEADGRFLEQRRSCCVFVRGGTYGIESQGREYVEEAVAGDPRTDIRIFGKPSARVNRRMGVVVGYEPHGSSLEALRERVCAAAAKVKVTE